jgi:hypothetical protein
MFFQINRMISNAKMSKSLRVNSMLRIACINWSLFI